jgi:hypothetical protein
MPTALSTPVITSQEAAARVAELGMEAELARMLEHVRREVLGLQSIKVIWNTIQKEKMSPGWLSSAR